MSHSTLSWSARVAWPSARTLTSAVVPPMSSRIRFGSSSACDRCSPGRHAAGRARLDQLDRPLARGAHAHHAAVRLHDAEGARQAGLAQRVLDRAERAVDHGREPGGDDGRRRPLVLLALRVDVGRQQHAHAGQRGGDQLARAPLVDVARVRVQEGDGDGLDARLGEGVGGGLDVALVERLHLGTGRVETAAHLEPQGARDERRRPVPVMPEQPRPPQAADVEQVAEARGGQQPDPGQPALGEGVGGDGRAEHQRLDVGRLGHLAQRGEHALDAVGGGRRLRRAHRARRVVRDDVGEGAAHVDSHDHGRQCGRSDRPRVAVCRATHPARPFVRATHRPGLAGGVGGQARGGALVGGRARLAAEATRRPPTSPRTRPRRRAAGWSRADRTSAAITRRRRDPRRPAVKSEPLLRR